MAEHPGRPGQDLLSALTAAQEKTAAAPPVVLVPTECLSVCRRPCTIALQVPGHWTYIFGDLSPHLPPAIIFDFVSRYRLAPKGIVPWSDRAEPFRKGVIARVPPMIGHNHLSNPNDTRHRPEKEPS